MTDRRVGGSAVIWWTLTVFCVFFAVGALLGVYAAVIVLFEAVFGA